MDLLGWWTFLDFFQASGQYWEMSCITWQINTFFSLQWHTCRVDFWPMSETGTNTSLQDGMNMFKQDCWWIWIFLFKYVSFSCLFVQYSISNNETICSNLSCYFSMGIAFCYDTGGTVKTRPGPAKLKLYNLLASFHWQWNNILSCTAPNIRSRLGTVCWIILWSLKHKFPKQTK